MLKKVGIDSAPNCRCEAMAARMDIRGTRWCRRNRDGVIREALRSGARAVGVPFNGLAASMLTERAIRCAEADRWHADDWYVRKPKPHPYIVCGMTTAPRREMTLVDSVLSLSQAGYAATVYAEPDTPLDGLPEWCNVVQRQRRYGAFHNWKAMAWELVGTAEESGAEYVGTFQDDIECSPHLRTMVESFPFDKRNGCLLLYTPAHYCNWEKPDHGWRAITSRSLWGALGIVVRTSDMRRLLESKAARGWLGAKPPRRDGEELADYKERCRQIELRNEERPELIANVDTMFGRAVRTKMHLHLPSLIRHTARFSTLGHGGNYRERNSASLLTTLPPEEKRKVIPRATKLSDRHIPGERRVVIREGAPAKSPVCKYHHAVRKHLSRQKPGSLLDVGSGVSRGVDWLKALPHFDRTSLELEDKGKRLKGVEMQFGDFQKWDDSRSFEYVVCMQVLEHTDDPEEFAAKLFRRATKQVVISIPYMWPQDAGRQHKWNNLTEDNLRQWVGVAPVFSQIIRERNGTKDGNPIRRLIEVYEP